MQKKQLVLGICLGGMLLGGCSSKPDIGDIEAPLKEFWKPCNLVKATSFKKTNGIDRGDSYQMVISYNLEIVRDIDKEDLMSEWRSAEISGAANDRVIKFYNENCPEPAGTYFAKLFVSNQERPLKKGENLDMSTEYTMIKSENGWIIR